ncbi:glutamate-5-semialdehyde dehydrogenase, partial [Geomonas sp.]|uniref:glutamate-5-semialdehyde dehydrogenase n=1 Tax=Geomonas sp. TaxID=2651584 RepID=UPI002B499EB8
MSVAEKIRTIAAEARKASFAMAKLSSSVKNDLLMDMAMALINNAPHIIEENKKDLAAGEKRGLSSAMLDRLMLNEARIKGMAAAIREVAQLPDPVGEVTGMWKRPNELMVGKMRIPLGVIGIIYESRPNVTSDAAALCLKSGNAVVLRGGSEAIYSNVAIARFLKEELAKRDIPEAALSLIPFVEREGVEEMLKQEEFIDVIIPRGGESLIRMVVEKSKIPVIKHYKGVCHVFVDCSADYEMAERIIVNAKTQRPGVCNALETLLIHKDVAETFVPRIAEALSTLKVELRGDACFRQFAPEAI